MKRIIHNQTLYNQYQDAIFCMSDVRGNRIKVEKNIPFSFYYSARNSSHGPRIKPIFNPSKINKRGLGTLKLCDDWSFTPGADDANVSRKQIDQLVSFARKYLVLFLLIWDELSENEPSLGDYFEGDISLEEFIQQLTFYNDYKDQLDLIYTVDQLEDFCRENKLVNFYGN